MTKRLNWKFVVGMLISALFVYLAFRKVDLARVWGLIQSANLFLFSLAIIITFFQFVIRAWRWGIILEPVKETRFSIRLHSTMIGFAANCVLPARLGEFIRANFLGQREQLGGSSAFATIVVERLFDGFTLLLILLIGLLGTTFPAEWQSVSGSLRGVGLLLLALYFVVIVFLVGFKYRDKIFLTLLDRLLVFLPKRFRSRILDVLKNFGRGLVLAKDPSKWAQAIFHSFFVWFLYLCQAQLIGQSLGLTLPFIGMFLVVSMACFGVIIPSAPGYIGTFHLSVQYGFLFYGLGREEALSAAIIWHASFFFPTILLGFISFLILNVSYGKPSEDSRIVRREHISSP